MTEERRLTSTCPAYRDDIGDLVTRRPLPGPGLPDLDPFLFLNHHGPQIYLPGNSGLPFGPHPHRGFETVTFIIAGELAHRDSGGHESVIHAGGVQWMTAGRGLVHAELSPDSFKRTGGPLEILQLWVNLPARLKMTDPAYRGLEAAAIPKLRSAGSKAEVHLVSGALDGREGPIRPLVPISLMLLMVEPGGSLLLPAPPGQAILFYTVRGEATAGGGKIAEHRLALFGDGDGIRVGSDNGATILYGHAAPFGEPIVAHGPFVMNSVEEIRQAVADYQSGRLGAL